MNNAKASASPVEPLFQTLSAFYERPEPFSHYTVDGLWTDPHIAARMLEFHLDPSIDLASRRPEVIDATVAWLDHRVGLAGKAVCDLGCGPGLYAERMAKREARVVGIDFSAGSLAYARQQAELRSSNIDYRQQNYLTDPLPSGVDLVCLVYCDLCALSPERRQTLYGQVRQSLKPGGQFVLDVFSHPQFEELTEASSVEHRLMGGFWAPGDYYGFKKTFLYPDRRLSLDRYLIVESHQIRELFNWLQYFDPHGICEELADAGFETHAVVDALSGEPWQGSPREFAVIARKPGAVPLV
ncbi:MAG: class I SAM-dependent methyltransferase [Pseudomonadota bacterium]